MQVAAELCDRLKPFCEHLVVAGSLRRRKAEVGDVEILYIPKFESRPDGLFDRKMVNLVDEELERALRSSVIRKRLNSEGSETWGPKNKLAVHASSGVPVDFFSTTPECWFNYLVCRTGGAESNVRIASAAQRKGWMWHPDKRGFTDNDGQWQAVRSEEDVFAMVGLPYLQPWER